MGATLLALAKSIYYEWQLQLGLVIVGCKVHAKNEFSLQDNRRYWNSLAVKCKSEENCAFDDKSTIFGTEIIEILKNIF